ncbi:unnamed protein product [Soboliphyme baturini]|uniref:Secreted protein n=1 Tax=Soboliphyme baturini TaxID=241478 RepID=A0A183IEQ8_9BILA|nr:unnamed protein product [Soboliphyme baturini]
MCAPVQHVGPDACFRTVASAAVWLCLNSGKHGSRQLSADAHDGLGSTSVYRRQTNSRTGPATSSETMFRISRPLTTDDFV